MSTITDGNAQAGAAAHFPPLRWPDCTLSRLRAEEYDRPGDPVDSDPGAVFEDDPHPRSDAGRPLEPLSVSPHSGADGLVQAELPPTSPEFLTVFTSLACSPRRTSRVGEDCRPRTTWRPLTLAGSPALPPLRLTGGFCHAD